jgi:sugar phosphate isomerase/epimerase
MALKIGNTTMNPSERQTPIDRRDFLAKWATAVSITAATGFPLGNGSALSDEPRPTKVQPEARKPTVFQHACMTLPYSAFPLQRALEGIQSAGYRFVAWGVNHREANGEQVPVMAEDATPEAAKSLGKRCRDLGLEPVMMFSTIYPEKPNAIAVLTQRIKQAAAAGIGQVLTFGHTQGGNRALWVERFKTLGPIARDHRVMIVVKQHGGTTGTGEACAEIIREVNDPNVFVNYDAGNVMDYLDLDPIPDIRKCAKEVRSFCVKDHRNWPKDEDCGPGFGEIDHYRLFEPVAFTGLTMPLAYENIFAPLVPRPATPEGIDALARLAREYLETLISGLQQAP